MAPMHTSDKIATLDQLMAEVKEWKKNKLKIVFTNGCFDILHVGHVDYLEKAKNLGDRLIIGLNTDLSVKKLKGTSRPIVGQGARSRIIASLAFVDAVILFEEETPLELIRVILPDILVKGGDYSIGNIIGSDIVISNGGKVKTINFVDGFSTTQLIEKIKQL